MLFDTHAHLNMAALQNEYKEIIAQCQKLGVLINNVGTQRSTSKRAVEIANEYENGVYATVGIHPTHTVFKVQDQSESVEELYEPDFDFQYYAGLAKDPKVIGIGECGLDYFRMPEDLADRSRMITKQKEIFEEHIKLAKAIDKTLIIHCRASKGSDDAYIDAIELLKKNAPLRFEVHSFTGNFEIAQKFLELGGYIALNGIITFDKTGVLEEVIKKITLQRLILETDAPYLAPLPYRGKQNLPQYVEYVARHIAEIRGISYEEIAKQTTENAKELFKV